ncbi:hypothetical protein CKM354_000910500 [Cercospora kikuchii]|uniref:Ankyrin n=1 Tax=Cercospora kikuchii TaxID=84275 RepID=A0A9P3FK49_9PEZI|nr:uncharacterized protein CKM354_000910500 [Cercospora kikuchii]GIZ45960.1 hypothetical protein CKM354_000910500 [Cercospora kikuchii]
MMEYLVERGAYVDAKNFDGRTALFRACSSYPGRNNEAENLQMVDILLERGASIDVEDNWNETPLCVAAIEGIHVVVKRLLDLGASANGSSKEGHLTPLMGACYYANFAVVHMLLERGAEVNRCHSRPGHSSGLDLDTLRGYKFRANVMLEQVQLRWTALAYSCGPYVPINRMEEMSSRLLAVGADPNLGDVVPLETAIIYGGPSVIKILLDAGADPSRVSENCIETLRGLHERPWRLYDKRKEKWELLQQYYPDIDTSGKHDEDLENDENYEGIENDENGKDL